MPAHCYTRGKSESFDADRLNIHSRRAPAVSITFDSSYTNVTFSTEVCNLDFTGIVQLELYSTTWRLLLPDCFLNKISSITALKLAGIIIQGNSTYPDPLRRLSLTISSTPTTFWLVSCYLITETNSYATINWAAISSITSSVTSLSLAGTHLGIGATMPTFPRPIASVDLTSTGLSGTLPSSLFDTDTPAPDSFYFKASSNALSGSIPPTLLANLNLTPLTQFSFFIDQNSLNGTIPSLLLAHTPFSNCTAIYLDISGNNFVGTLYDLFPTPTTFSSSLTSFIFYGSSNNFTGSTPIWFSSMEDLSTFTFECNECQLQTLAPTFLAVSSRGCIFTISIANNLLSGDIPSTFFQLGDGSATIFKCALNGNNLSGTIALDSISFLSTPIVSIDISSNNLTGFPNSPGVVAPQLAAGLVYYLTIHSNPSMTGTIPPSFLNAFGSSSLFILTASNTGLTGELVLPDWSLVTDSYLVIECSDTNFTSLSFPENATSGLTQLTLSSSSPLTGHLPTSFFINNPGLIIFDVPQSHLSGNMPDMGASNPLYLSTLVLNSSSIDFCSGTRSNWSSSSLTSCSLTDTNAYYCQDLYPSTCLFSVPSPSEPPSSEPASSPPNLVPIPSAPPSPSGCSNSTRPSSEWICIGGTWTFLGSVNSTTIVIPSGATLSIIKGNLTSSTVIINGLNSIIIVDGCTSNTTIIVELTPQQLEEIGRDGKLQQLLSFSNTSICNSSTSDITIGTHVKGSSCKTVSVSKVPSSNGSFSGLFTVDKSGCNTWWIILVSVLCAIVLIGLVVAIIAYVIYNKRVERKSHERLKAGG